MFLKIVFCSANLLDNLIKLDFNKFITFMFKKFKTTSSGRVVLPLYYKIYKLLRPRGVVCGGALEQMSHLK